MLEESGIAEIEIKEGEESVRISRAMGAGTQYAPHTLAPPPSVAPQSDDITAEPDLQGHVVESPMVGTYYSAASPGESDFVKVGQYVQQGDTLCIIEAMKIMNHIEADARGTIIAIKRQNGDAVEYGDPLFVIES